MLTEKKTKEIIMRKYIGNLRILLSRYELIKNDFSLQI